MRNLTTSGKTAAVLLMILGSVATFMVLAVLLVPSDKTTELRSDSAHVTAVKQETKEVSSITVRGRVIRLGMTSDKVFEILHHDDETSPAETSPDPRMASSLIVMHHYLVDSGKVTVEFKRQEHDGPYIVTKMQVMASRVHSDKSRRFGDPGMLGLTSREKIWPL